MRYTVKDPPAGVPHYFTVAEAAKLTRFDEKTIRRWLREGRWRGHLGAEGTAYRMRVWWQECYPDGEAPVTKTEAES